MAQEDLSLYAILHELNGRAFRRRIDGSAEALRYYVILADALVGIENSRRIGETPPGIVTESEQFVEKLKGMVNPSEDETFGEVLLACTLDALKGELKFSCLNCKGFGRCLRPEQLPIGELFSRRVNGEDSAELRDEIGREADAALQKIPYYDAENADERCVDFEHNHSAGSLGEIFRRYTEMAGVFAVRYAFDYRRFISELVTINMDFVGKAGETGEAISGDRG